MTARRCADDAPSPRGFFPRSACVVVVALMVTACLPWRHSEDITPRRSPARDSLLAADLRRVDTLTARGLSATLASYLAPDAVYLRPGAPAVFGRDNMLVLIASAPTSAGAIVAWQPIGGGVSRDELSGYTFGIAVHAIPEKPAPAVERYIAYWSRLRGGPWRIAAYAEVGATPVVLAGPIAGAEVPRRELSRQAQSVVHSLAWADSNFAERALLFGPGTGFGDAVADDGVLLGGSELIVGPRAIREYFASQRGVSLSWRPRFAVAAASGDLGFTVGESVATSRGPSGAAVQGFSKYLTIWRKEPNGRWKFVVDGGNSRPSPVGE